MVDIQITIILINKNDMNLAALMGNCSNENITSINKTQRPNRAFLYRKYSILSYTYTLHPIIAYSTLYVCIACLASRVRFSYDELIIPNTYSGTGVYQPSFFYGNCLILFRKSKSSYSPFVQLGSGKPNI